jgi:hypothetical protein
MISDSLMIKSEHLHFCPTLPRFRGVAPLGRPTVPAFAVAAGAGAYAGGVAVPCGAYVMPPPRAVPL